MVEKSLEELLLETEERILNNDFYKKYNINYEGEDYTFYLKPVSQRIFMQLYTMYGKEDIGSLYHNLIKECLVHEDGTGYKKELIDILLDKMPAGFTSDIAKHIYEISGIKTDKDSLEEAERFLKGTS